MAAELFRNVPDQVRGKAIAVAQTQRASLNLNGATFWLARLDTQRVGLLEAPPEEGAIPDPICFETTSDFGFGRMIAWPLQRSLFVCQTSGRVQNTKLLSTIRDYGTLFFWRMRGRHMLEPTTSTQKKLMRTKEVIELSFSKNGIPLTISDLKTWDPKGYPGSALPITTLREHLERIRAADTECIDTGDELVDDLSEAIENGQHALRVHRPDADTPYYDWVKRVYPSVRDNAVAMKTADRLGEAEKLLEASRFGAILEGDMSDASPEQAWDYVVKNTLSVLGED